MGLRKSPIESERLSHQGTRQRFGTTAWYENRVAASSTSLFRSCDPGNEKAHRASVSHTSLQMHMDLALFASPDAQKLLIQRYKNEPDILAIEEFGVTDNFHKARDDDFDLVAVVPTNAANTETSIVAIPTSDQHTPNSQLPWPGLPEVYPNRIHLRDVRYTERMYIRQAVEAAGHVWAAAWQIKTAMVNPVDLFPPRHVRYGQGAPFGSAHEPGKDDEEEGMNIWPDDLDDETSYMEGAKKRVTVNAYERNRRARAHCIKHYGPICQACDIDFGERYGPSADGFIHVHHRKPISETDEEYRVNPIEDLVPVCPNCHAVIHMDDQMKTIQEVRVLLGKG